MFAWLRRILARREKQVILVLQVHGLSQSVAGSTPGKSVHSLSSVWSDLELFTRAFVGETIAKGGIYGVALWNADRAVQACLCAKALLRHLRSQASVALPEISYRIGMGFGDCYVGLLSGELLPGGMLDMALRLSDRKDLPPDRVYAAEEVVKRSPHIQARRVSGSPAAYKIESIVYEIEDNLAAMWTSTQGTGALFEYFAPPTANPLMMLRQLTAPAIRRAFIGMSLETMVLCRQALDMCETEEFPPEVCEGFALLSEAFSELVRKDIRWHEKEECLWLVADVLGLCCKAFVVLYDAVVARHPELRCHSHWEEFIHRQANGHPAEWKLASLAELSQELPRLRRQIADWLDALPS